jgi:nitrate reductase gamma subunit
MSSTALLLWAKGPGFVLAALLFALGVAERLVEILWLGRKTDLARARGHAAAQAARTLLARFLPAPGLLARSPVVHVGGYAFHLGLAAVVVLYAPHIAVLRALFHVGWGGLPGGMVDGITALTVVAMLSVLAARLADPVKRLLSESGDYVAWTVTFLPLLTGILAVNRLWLPFETLLALHLLSVELLLAAFPFTRLMHAFTFVLARSYTGAIAGRKGAHS